MDNADLITVLNKLVSEEQNPETLDIDLLSSVDIVTKINAQDHKVSQAISKVLPVIAQTVDEIVATFKNGGRLVYMGAGTSGRLGVLDAVECIPTFGIEQGMVVAVLAGGESAMFKAKEGVEDQEAAGEDSLKDINLKNNDLLVGIAASGRTPFVIGGLKYASKIGTKTVALSCNPKAEIANYSDLAILAIVGQEPLTGSTRMKSGTAQKMILNMLSTASMIRIGKSYKNLMVDLKATNEKLYARGTRMIMQVTGVEQSVAEDVLNKSDKLVKVAILMLLAKVDATKANKLLVDAGGFLRKALLLK
ncbi:MAG: N-acetylmuramic acid 6-phosphate etherase [Gammaproteobacteria bacterium]|nr:MAG: N-acetylmuramic acid 6-phosphate etherase [Gammaproteobacteria bacterium]